MDSIAQTERGTIDFGASFASLASEQSVVMGGQTVRLVAFSGTGGWHKHDSGSETVVVWGGTFDVEYRERTVRLNAGQCTVIAPGDEHRGVSQDGAQIVLFRAATP